MKLFFHNSRTDNQKGVALLLVIAAIALLTGMVVEFMNNTRVTQELGYNQKERAQAYYLAQSGIQFARLVVSLDKEVRKLTDQASKKLGTNVVAQPLYEMIPISSGFMREMTGVGAGGEDGEGPETEPTGEKAEGLDVEKTGEAFKIIDTAGAKDFLAFEGDFAAEVEEEEAKINLNAFFTLAPTAKEYERLKNVIYHLLLTDEFKGMFEDRFRGAKELAQNIADFIDRDEAVHENGEERGREGVGSSTTAPMKNGKLLTVEELIMVPGMNEAIFQKMKPYVTAYGKDDKILLCRSAEPLLAAAVLAYTENNPKMEPLRDENVELVNKAKEAVLNSCPDAQAMASELDKVLGVVETPETDTSSGTETSPTTVKQGDTSKSPTKNPKDVAGTFGSMLKDQANIFKITGIGTVGETEVRLKVVIDTSGGSSKSWKELYWRVE